MSTSTRYARAAERPWEVPGTLLEAWCTAMRAQGLSPRTVEERPRIVARAAAEIGKPVDQLDDRTIESWLADLERPDGTPASAGTRATYYGALKAWHRWLLVTKRRGDDPMALLRTPRVPRRVPRPLAPEAVRRLEGIRMWRTTRVMIHLAALQGLRVHEIARVRGEDVDLYVRTLTVLGKGGVRETLPLHEQLVDDARHMPRTGWWFPGPTGDRPIRRDTVSATISRAIRRAGLTGSAHQLRHWYGTNLVRSGADVRVAQTLLRHASLATTALYVRVDQDQQRAAIARLSIERAA